ncbi:MAG: hypothetical protein H6725_18085 [Sandaracinaceae bacterium]|nr:hypothetical protein [Sandaracinaceae bacterium]
MTHPLVRLVSALAVLAGLATGVSSAAAQSAAHHHPLELLVAPDAVGLIRVDMAVLRAQGQLDLLAPPVGDATGAEAARRAALRTVAERASEVLVVLLPGTPDEPPFVALARGSFEAASLPPAPSGATDVVYRGFTLRSHDALLGGFVGTQTFVLGDSAGVRAVIDRMTTPQRGAGATDAELVRLAADVHLYTAPLAAAMRLSPAHQQEVAGALPEGAALASVGLELTVAGRNLNLRVVTSFPTPAEASGFARGVTTALRELRRSPMVRELGLGALLGSVRARARGAVVTVSARVRPQDVRVLTEAAVR